MIMAAVVVMRWKPNESGSNEEGEGRDESEGEGVEVGARVATGGLVGPSKCSVR